MTDQEKSKEELIAELVDLRRRFESIQGGNQTNDATGLAEANATLQRSRELQAIYNGIVEGLLIADIETKRFLRVNRSFCEMSGYSEPELLASSISDIHLPEVVLCDLQQYRAEGGAEEHTCFHAGCPIPRKDGSILYADVSGHWIVYDDRPSVMALFRNVTDRRQAQQALRQEREALRRLLHASDQERELITFEIHDGVSQRLAGALLHFQAVAQQEAAAGRELPTSFEAGLAALQEAATEARSLMNRTRTPVLQRFGIGLAVGDCVDQLMERPNSPEIFYECEANIKRLEPALERTIYRVAQEAISNACLHSRSDVVRVKLACQGDDLVLDVQDNGVGFDVNKNVDGHYGLDGIRERTRLLGKELVIESTPGRGTLVRAVFPLIYRNEEDT